MLLQSKRPCMRHAQVLIEVAQAIQHLHAMKLIHCDIKPENVLLKVRGPHDRRPPVHLVLYSEQLGCWVCLHRIVRDRQNIITMGQAMNV